MGGDDDEQNLPLKFHDFESRLRLDVAAHIKDQSNFSGVFGSADYSRSNSPQMQMRL